MDVVGQDRPWAREKGVEIPLDAYDEALEINGHIPNFASILRTTCALYLRDRQPPSEFTNNAA